MTYLAMELYNERSIFLGYYAENKIALKSFKSLILDLQIFIEDQMECMQYHVKISSNVCKVQFKYVTWIPNFGV